MDLTNPQSLNRYAYVMNNPMNAVDFLGLNECEIDPWTGACRNTGLDGGGGDGGGGGGPDPCGYSVETPCYPIPPISPFPLPGGGGGGGNKGGSGIPAEPTVNPGGKPPLSGETLGLPNGMSIQQRGLLAALGVPLPPDCEFGSCTPIGSGFGPSGAPFTNHGGLDSVFELLGWHIWYFDHVSDPNLRLFGTHYCGPGGGGTTKGQLDEACMAHDACYKAAGVEVWDNWNLNLSPDKQAAIQQCNQNLCNAARSIKGSAAWAVNQTFTNAWGVYTCQ